MCLSVHSLLQAGRCLYLETLISALRGVPESPSNSRPPPPLLSPTGTRRPGSPAPALSARSRSRPPWRSLPAPFPRAKSGPVVGWVGPRPLGSWSLLCSCPAPPDEGRREGNGGCSGEASGGPGRGCFRLSYPGWVYGLPEARRAGPVSAPASSGLFARLGLGEKQPRALELGPYPRFPQPPWRPSLSLPLGDMGGKGNPLREGINM